MATRHGVSRGWASGGGLARPIVAYLATVIVGAWVYLVAGSVNLGTDLGRAPVEAAAALVGNGPGVPTFLAFLLVPALVLTIELVHRSHAASRAARSILGAASWDGWLLFLALSLSLASRVVVDPGTVAVYLVLFAVAGAVFACLAFDGHATRPGRALVVLAMAVTVCVVLGSFWMAGRWGSAV